MSTIKTTTIIQFDFCHFYWKKQSKTTPSPLWPSEKNPTLPKLIIIIIIIIIIACVMRNFVERNFVGGAGGGIIFFLQQSNNNTHNNNNNNNSNKKKKKKKKRLLSIPNEIFWCHSKAQVNPRLQCACRSIPTCPQSCRREKDTKRKTCIAVAARRRACKSVCKSSEDCFAANLM